MKLLIDVWDHFNAELNEVYAESLAGLPIAAALTPIGGGEGYSTYELDFTGEALTHSGDAELLIAVKSETSGYGGLLPGKPVCAYFKHTVHVRKPLGWARTWGGYDGDNSAMAIAAAIDGLGDIYIAGHLDGTADFDPGPGIEELTSNGKDDGCLSKFNPNGNLLWARNWGGDDFVIAYGVAADGIGNAYVTGQFRSTADFDPGPGIYNRTSYGGYDAFLIKLPPDGNW